MDTHASVRPDIKNQDAFVGTISVDGHNTIARAKKERERERKRKQILSTPSGPLFIKRDPPASPVPAGGQSLTAPTWDRREIAVLRSGFGFLFTLLPFPLRSYLSLNVSLSFLSFPPPSLSLSLSLCLSLPLVLSKGAGVSRRAIYRALISIASPGESYRHTSSILELPALDSCVPSCVRLAAPIPY